MINPIPFGETTALFAFVSLIGIDRDGTRGRVIAALAFTAGLASSFLSQTRGAWLAIPVFVIVLLVHFRARYGTRIAFIGGAALAGLLLVAVVAAGPALKARLDETFAMFRGYDSGADTVETRTLDQRLLLWTYGLDVFRDHPALGVGPQAAVPVVQALAAADGKEILDYSHLHDAYLTEAVGNGLIGLATLLLVIAAPVVTAWRGRRDRARADRLAFAIMVVAQWVLSGLTGIAFGHDILNTVYVTALLVVCLSTARSAREGLP
jgi:O-antigen ligase